jgi:hypothetical protein
MYPSRCRALWRVHFYAVGCVTVQPLVSHGDVLNGYSVGTLRALLDHPAVASRCNRRSSRYINVFHSRLVRIVPLDRLLLLRCNVLYYVAICSTALQGA